jgi:hypothetical protein
MSREITTIAMDLTTVCDRACPNCCCGINMGMRPAKHHPWEYFVEAARSIYGIERIDVFGGEPTTHPKFAEFIPQFKKLFGCRTLTITTDGFKVQQHAETMKHFDFIQATPYDARNALAMAFLKASYQDVRFFPGDFVPRSRVGGGKPCARATSETIAYADGKLWPCCPGPGINGNVGMEPSADWRERIGSVPMACETCFFSQ